MRALLRIVAVCVAALAFLGTAAAEEIIATLSQTRISITSNFFGGSIVVFGAIKSDRAPRAYDLVATAVGPRETVTSWRKGRIAGVWINESSQTFTNIPSYFGVFSNRQLGQIASESLLRTEKIGLKNALLEGRQVDESNSFLANLVRIRLDEGLYKEQSRAVTFLSQSAFRAEVPLPANIPTGDYTIDLKLFSDGAVVAQSGAAFVVAKAGVEEFVVKAAANYSLLYGLATMIMGLLTGWLASIAFGKN